jgi:hypothetical protein
MKVKIDFEVIEVEKTKENGDKYYFCYMPSIDCYFNAKDKDEIKKKANAMVVSFLNNE